MNTSEDTGSRGVPAAISICRATAPISEFFDTSEASVWFTSSAALVGRETWELQTPWLFPNANIPPRVKWLSSE